LKNTDSRRNKTPNSDSAAKHYPENIPTSTEKIFCCVVNKWLMSYYEPMLLLTRVQPAKGGGSSRKESRFFWDALKPNEINTIVLMK